MARMAVGAVNMEQAPFSDRTRKKAPGSGVPTGLPCKQTVKHQLFSSQTVTLRAYKSFNRLSTEQAAET